MKMWVHPSARAELLIKPATRRLSNTREDSIHNFIFMTAAIWLVKGFATRLNDIGLYFVLQEYGLDASTMQTYHAVLGIPLVIKPLLGSLVDTFDFGRIRLSMYIWMSCLTGLMAASLISFTTSENMPAWATVVSMCIFLFTVTFVDTLAFSVNNKRKGQTDLSTRNFLSMGHAGFQLIASLGSLAFLSDAPRALYLLGGVSFFLMQGGANYASIHKVRPSRNSWCHKTGINCIITGMAALLIGLTALLQAESYVSRNVLLMITTVLLGLILGARFWLLPRETALILSWMTIQTTCSLQLDAADYFFFTDDWEAYPGGPNLTVPYFIVVAGVLTLVFSFFSYTLFLRLLRNRSLKQVMVGVNLLLCLFHVPTVILYTRSNLNAGIPDKCLAWVHLGIQGFHQVILWIPLVFLFNQICPAGLETSTFGLMAGAQHVGTLVSSILGSRLLYEFGVRPNGHHMDTSEFRNLKYCGLICACLPLLSVGLAPLCLPDIRRKVDGDEINLETMLDSLDYVACETD